jgi:ankyrin repeat protein
MCTALLVEYVTMPSYPNILKIITDLIKREPSVLDTPLVLETACKSSIEIVQYLISRTKQLPDNILNLTLQYACKGLACVDVAILLINSGAKIHLHDKSNSNYTSLLYAIALDSEPLVSLLLDKGATINEYQDISRWDSGYTPLLHAVRLGRTNLVRLLLKRGARTDQCHIYEQGCADNFYYDSALEMADSDAIATLLIEHGAK